VSSVLPTPPADTAILTGESI